MHPYKVYDIVQLLNLGKNKEKHTGEQYLFESKQCPNTQLVIEYSDLTNRWEMAIDAMDNDGGVKDFGGWLPNDGYVKWPVEICVDDWTPCDDMGADIIRLLEQIHGDTWINQDRNTVIALIKETQDE